MNNETNDNREYEYVPEEEVQEEPSSAPVKRKKEKRPRKKRRKKYYTLKFLILIATCVALYFFAHSGVFTVEKIQLEKNDRFTLKQVKKMTGMKKGVNLFEINTGDYEDKLEENPFIREAEVSRKLPDTIQVSLDLRKPVAVIKQNKKYVMIDREGTVLAIRKELPHYTRFHNLTVQKPEKGQTVKIKEEKKYNEYMELLDEMNAADLYFRGMVIKKDSVKLFVRSDLYCVGTKENIIAGMRDGNLKAVLYRLSQKGIKKGVVEVGDDQYYSYSKAKK